MSVALLRRWEHPRRRLAEYQPLGLLMYNGGWANFHLGQAAATARAMFVIILAERGHGGGSVSRTSPRCCCGCGTPAPASRSGSLSFGTVRRSVPTYQFDRLADRFRAEARQQAHGRLVCDVDLGHDGS